MRFAAILLIAIILAASVPAHAGGPREIALGVGFGTTLGILGGGTGLIFAAKPDDEAPTYLWIGAGAGFIAGLLFGVFVPAREYKPFIDDYPVDDEPEAMNPFAPLGWKENESAGALTIPGSRSIASLLTFHAQLIRLDF